MVTLEAPRPPASAPTTLAPAPTAPKPKAPAHPLARLLMIIEKLLQKEEAVAFREPVNLQEVPDYLTVSIPVHPIALNSCPSSAQPLLPSLLFPSKSASLTCILFEPSFLTSLSQPIIRNSSEWSFCLLLRVGLIQATIPAFPFSP